MPVTEIGDPRLQALFGANDPRDAGVRPTVRLARSGIPTIAIALGAVILGFFLFLALSARRNSEAEPDARSSPPIQFDSPPPLSIPPIARQPALPSPLEERKSAVASAPAPLAAPAIQPRALYAPPQAVPQFAPPMPPAPQPRSSAGAPLVIDAGGGAETPAAASGAPPVMPSTQTVSRVRASAFANRSMTVPQGFLIPAVLETGFDSTRPGFARAVVSRDVRGFDGKNVLIPRGSRLIGEYRAEVEPGQSRAVITWTRLLRPDGMTIAMDSPAVDTLGRGGVKASVNTHFFQRLGDALLQSTIGIGSALAQRSVTGPVVVVGSNGANTVAETVPTTTYVPTLTVPAGKSISVFVARDLDFSAAGAGR